MTYRAGDKIVVELDEQNAHELNTTSKLSSFLLSHIQIKEHIPRPEPIKMVLVKYPHSNYWKMWSFGDSFPLEEFGHAFSAIRKLTIDEETGHTTIEIIK